VGSLVEKAIFVANNFWKSAMEIPLQQSNMNLHVVQSIDAEDWKDGLLQY